ncbi:MAG: S8 family serine peptidase [candidate division KSB1 bacterium]|nr:S8 family serine peptidase [candidate division KSB1 bacterium]MDZ7288282.1 S8 family serine peptidase [candidate division KSB1 bacterium]MDZ7300494.1 S8 family serine peptidase [candidate division KSB1 bacterium]MDZ7308075.1 S8 family serine peptidase [candidate division KSB1 bacterium]MDZ7351492.1 S8 family serine peptidase [candidate division KSB1 bacterium]
MARKVTMVRRALLSLLTLMASGVLILTASRSGRTQSPADYSFTDKLFGKHFVFMPKPDEIMVRFAVKAKRLDRASAEAAVVQSRLTVVHEALARYDFGVYRLPAGSDLESVAAQLRASGTVQAICPVMIDQDGYTRYFMPDEFTVQFDERLPEAEMLAIIRNAGCRIVKKQWTPGYYTLSLPPDRELFATIREFMRLPQVKFAEPSYIGFNDFAFDPNDASYAQQWALRNTGATGGTADADIDAREAWDIERGDANVVVVIIDTGVDWDHPDLRPNILQNLGEDADGDGQTMELAGGNWVLDPGDLNGIDNDGNGRSDDLIGWDFDDDDNNPDDEGNHGTACAGIAAAVTDNAMGVAGVAHNCRILPLRINLTAGMNQNRADAINYAAAMSANYDGMVLSCSWIASGDVTALRSAIVNAKNDGVVVCFAAGNFDETSVRFPARVEAAIAVGATSECDERKSPTSCDGETAWGSNRGDSLDIAAPGVHIFTTDRAGADGYDAGDYVSDFNGTSSATPHVAGAAALLLSYDPSLTPDEVQDILQVSADRVGGYNYNHDATRPGHSLELGYGRLNVNRALQELIARKVITLQPEPVDIALSIDRSGSMTPPKLSAARNAAAQVVRLMNIGDRVAVTSYDHNVFVNFNLANITSEAVKDNAIAAINAITAGGATSIGGGLVTAQGQFLLAVPPHYPQAIILMSDGMSNTAPWVRQVTPLLPGSTDVYTIGFATSGVDIDEDSLQYIAGMTGGQYFFAGADGLGAAPAPHGKQDEPGLITSATGGLELIKSYQASLNIASGRQMMRHVSRKYYQDQYSDSVFVDASVDEMRFSFLLDSKPATLLFELRTPGGKTIDPGVAAGDPLIDYLEDATLASYTVRKPERGLWLVVARAARVGKMFLSASGYSHLKGILTVEEFGLRLPLLVQLRLIERGLPVLKSQVRGQLGLPNNQFLPFQLFDDGKHRDGQPNDGIYGNSIFASATGGLLEGGSYTVETTATGFSNLSGDFYTRYNVASVFIPFKRERHPIRVSLPNSIALPKRLVRIPIQINNDVFGRDLGSFAAGIRFDPGILQPTGKFDTRNTMLNAAWAVDLNTAQPGLLEMKASGPALEGNGVLLHLLFEVTGKLDERTPLAFSHFEFNGGAEPVETSDGSFTVGSTFLERTVTLNKPKGWSLTSLPVESIEPSLRGLFPKAQAAFKFVPGEGYQAIDQLEPATGFWLSLSEGSSATVTGLPVAEAGYQLAKGWNLIGGLYDQAARPQTKPANAIQAMFRFIPQTGYVATTEVLPGEAVWVSCAQPCSLWLSQAINAAAPPAIAGELAWEATITATGQESGAAVNVSSVVIGAGTSGTGTLPAPPTAPQFTTNLQLWELNFTGGPFAKDTRAINTPESKWVLEVDPHGNVPPPTPRSTTVSWDAGRLGAGTWELRDGFDGTGALRIADMKSTTSFVVTGTSAQYFTIIYKPVLTGVQEGQDETPLPDRFALHQNYPNPFNPETAIRYDLPQASEVSIRLYNVTGQLVRTLVSGRFPAGVHVVRWDGRNDHGQRVGAGVYFYSLKTAAFQQRRKMVLLP